MPKPCNPKTRKALLWNCKLPFFLPNNFYFDSLNYKTITIFIQNYKIRTDTTLVSCFFLVDEIAKIEHLKNKKIFIQENKIEKKLTSRSPPFSSASTWLICFSTIQENLVIQQKLINDKNVSQNGLVLAAFIASSRRLVILTRIVLLFC